jgi:hypothetical protein
MTEAMYMTRAEQKKILAILITAWPEHRLPDTTLQLYAELLADLPYAAVVAAVRRLIQTRVYPTIPTVGEIRRTVADLMLPRLPTPDEAWAQVSEANRRWGYMHPQQALDSLHPLVRRVASAIGWRAICESEQPDVIRAQFTRLYGYALDRARTEAVLPPGLQDGALACPDQKFAIGDSTSPGERAERALSDALDSVLRSVEVLGE